MINISNLTGSMKIEYECSKRIIFREFEDGLNKIISNIPKEQLLARTCPICERHTQEREIFRTQSYTYHICMDCSLAFAKRVPTKEENKKIYNCGAYEKLMKWQYNNIKRGLIQSEIGVVNDIKMFAPSRQVLVELGPGFGELLSRLRDDFSTVYGIELNGFCVEKAKELFNLELLRCELHEMGIEESSVDVAVLSQVVEHLPSLNPIKDLIKLLRPNGILFIGTPNFRALSMRLFKAKHSHVIAPVHINMFTEQSIRHFARLNGMEVVKCISDKQLDISASDLYYWLFRRCVFRHRINDGISPIAVSIWDRIIKNSVDKFNLLPRWNLGSYLRVILRKKPFRKGCEQLNTNNMSYS